MRRVVIHWGISSFFGWGVYGLNLALHWARDREIEAFGSFPIQESQIAVDKLRRLSLDGFVDRSRWLGEQLAARAGRSLDLDGPLLAALGNDFRVSPGAHGVHLKGKPTVGVVFFEQPQLDAETVARARSFPLVEIGRAHV
jgi:hypothetical protein